MGKKTRKRPKILPDKQTGLVKEQPVRAEGKAARDQKDFSGKALLAGLPHYVDDILKWTIVVAVFLLPLIVSPAGFDAFDLTKATTLYLLTVFMLFFYLVKVVFSQKVIRHRTLLDLPVLFFGLMAVLATALSEQPFMSILGEYGRYETIQVLLAYVFIFYVASEYFHDRDWIERLILSLLCSTLLIAVYGIRQGFGWEWLADFLKRPEARSRSSLGNAVFFGGFLATVFPLFVYGFFDRGKAALRSIRGEQMNFAIIFFVLLYFGTGCLIWANTASFALVGVVCLAAAIWMAIKMVPRPFAYAIFCFLLFQVGLAGTVFAESRGAWLGTFVALEFLIVLWLFLDRLKLAYVLFGFIMFEEAVAAAIYIKIGGTPMTILVIFCVMAAGLYLFYLLLKQNFRQYFDFSALKEKASRFAEGLALLVATGILIAFLTVFWGARGGSPAERMAGLSDRFKSSFVMTGGTTATRFEIWKGCIKMIKDRPLLGFGPDQMINWFPRYRTLRYTQLEGEMTMPDRAHNDVIQIAVNLGMFGLLAYFWILAALALTVHRHLKDNYDTLVLGLSTVVLAYFIQNLFSIAIIGITSVFWIMVAVLAALVARDKKRGREKLVALEFKQELSPAAKTVLVVILLGIAVVAGRLATIPQEADVYYFLANYGSQTGSQNIPMLELFQKAYNTNPYRSMYRQTLGSIYSEKSRINNDLSGLKQTIALYEEGMKINPRDEDLAIRLADCYLNYAAVFDPTWYPKGEAALKQVIELDPLFAYPRLELNRIYLSRNDFEKVIEGAYAILQVQPRNQDALYQIAFSYEATGALNKAYMNYKQLSNLNPEYPGVQDALARLKRPDMHQ